MVQYQLEKAKEDYKCFADQHHHDVLPLAVGNRVWLSTRYVLMTQPLKKLNHHYLGPFRVEAVIKTVEFCLSLPWTMRIHP
ncbi:hypothetical protein L345_18401, partial [Ophiophagus hannah]